jgi:hypothetical protein
MELGALSGDLDMYPYEVLEAIARRLGFGPALERALDGLDGRDGLGRVDDPDELDGLDDLDGLDGALGH